MNEMYEKERYEKNVKIFTNTFVSSKDGLKGNIPSYL